MVKWLKFWGGILLGEGGIGVIQELSIRPEAQRKVVNFLNTFFCGVFLGIELISFTHPHAWANRLGLRSGIDLVYFFWMIFVGWRVSWTWSGLFFAWSMAPSLIQEGSRYTGSESIVKLDSFVSIIFILVLIFFLRPKS